MVRKQKVPLKRKSFSFSGSAPVGGLNVRDPIQSMPQNDAIVLKNWIAQQYGVRSRKGYVEWAINLGAEVKTVMSYSPARSNIAGQKLFAATDAAIYDITTSTNAPAVSQVLSGSAEAGRLHYAMFTNAAGAFLLTAADAGGYRYYNGAAWATPTFGGGAGQVSGVDPANLVHLNLWKRRIWAVEKNSTKVWYGGVDAITGAFTALDVGPFMKHGGVVSWVANWTIDAGEGIDDFLVIAGENGDILIYKGTDPSAAATFAMVGSWYVGRLPLGRRCYDTLGGDLLVFSETGLQPLSYVTRGGQSLLRASSVDYLGKIQPLFDQLAADLLGFYGFELNYNQTENLMVIQVPAGVNQVYQQYALYTGTNKWCQLDGMSMNCSDSNPQGYFYGTTDGKVIKAFTGYFDNVVYGATTGNGISGVIQPAYSYFNKPGMNKQWTMVRPWFLATDIPGVSAQMFADYNSLAAVPPVYGVSLTGALWDVADWDVGIWGGSLTSFGNWVGVSALGYTGSLQLYTYCIGDTFLASIDYIYEPGGEM